MIYNNLKRTKLIDKAQLFRQDYRKCLKEIKDANIKFDIIFLDPPYKENLAANAVKQIISLELLQKDGIIIVETDEKERDLKELEKLQVEMYDLRKYGRVYLIFLSRKG